MVQTHGGYEISDDRDRIDFEQVHAMLTTSYWSPGVSIERVRKAASNSSLVIGAYLGDEVVGYTRVVSDMTTFGWVCDVFVREDHRKKGLAKAMVRFALDHPDHKGMRRWILATRDAHDVYRDCGFAPIKSIHRWMIYGENPPAENDRPPTTQCDQ